MTAFSLNFNKLVEATLLEEDQKVKTETGNELSDEKTVTDMDEYVNMSILTFIQKFTAQQKKEVST